MSMMLDQMVARERYNEMLREAEEGRRAAMSANTFSNGSLLSRMVKLLSRSSRPKQNSELMERMPAQNPLAEANGS